MKGDYAMESSVTNVIKHSAKGLSIILSDNDAIEIKQKLIDSGALPKFIAEMENLIFKQIEEGN